MALPCKCALPEMPTLESLTAKIDTAKEQASAALDSVQGTFYSLEATLSEGISMQPVKETLTEIETSLAKLAADPTSALGSAGCIAGMCMSLSELTETLKSGSGAMADLMLDFSNGAIDKIVGTVNEMIAGLQGIGAAISTTLGALADVPALLATVTAAFAGDQAAKLSAASDIELFADKADLKLTNSLLDKVFGSLAKLAKSADLDRIMTTLVSLGAFLSEVPAKLVQAVTGSSIVKCCITIPEPIKQLLDMIQNLAQMFNAEALLSAFEYAKSVAASGGASLITGPIAALDSTLSSSASALKLMAKTA